MRNHKIDEDDEMELKNLAQQGFRDAVAKFAMIITPVLVSVMLGCLIAFFKWSVAQHHAAELVAREHSKAIEAIVEWQKQWKEYPTDSRDLVSRAERLSDSKISKLQGETQGAISALSGQISAMQSSIGELKGYVQTRNGIAKGGP
jgi:hypothetical protein